MGHNPPHYKCDHVNQMQGVFYGPRVIRWTPHPETVNRIVSLTGKVVSVPILSPLIVGKISDKLVWVTTTVDLYHRTGNVRCLIHMSHDTPCHSVVWVSRRRRDDTGTPKNKNIHICMWSKVDGVLIGDIPGYFYSILVHFVHLETAGGWRWRYSGFFT